MGDKQNSKWRQPPSWIYYYCHFWSHGLFPVVAGYTIAKFHSSVSNGSWVISVCAKIQDGGRRHLKLLFCNAGPPTKPVCGHKLALQILCWSSLYFSRYRDLNISQIWLKMLILAPKNHVFEKFWPLNFIFYHRDSQKTLPCAETRVLSPYWSWSVLRCDLDVRRRVQKKKEPKVSQNSPFSQTPFPLSHINQILLAGSYPGYLSWFWVSERSVEKCGSSGVEFLAFPLTWHIAYLQQLVATAQAVIISQLCN